MNTIIVLKAREYFNKKYPFAQVEDGSYEFELYTDYRDELDKSTIKEAFENSNSVEEIREQLYQAIVEGYLDSLADYEDEIANEVLNYMVNVLDKEVLTMLDNNGVLDKHQIRDILVNEANLYSASIDFDKIIGKTDINILISLESSVSINHEFSINEFNMGLIDWIESVKESLEDGDYNKEDVSLITLLESQGYSFEDFEREVNNYSSIDGYESTDTFLKSLVHECRNATSSLNALVFTKRVSLLDYIKGEAKLEKIDKRMYGGYIDFINGAGSLFELQLKNDIDLTNVPYEIILDDNSKYGFSMTEIYSEFFVNTSV